MFCPHKHFDHLLGDIESVGFGAGEGERVRGMVKASPPSLEGVSSPANPGQPSASLRIRHCRPRSGHAVGRWQSPAPPPPRLLPSPNGAPLASLGLTIDPQEVSPRPSFSHRWLEVAARGRRACLQQPPELPGLYPGPVTNSTETQLFRATASGSPRPGSESSLCLSTVRPWASHFASQEFLSHCCAVGGTW